MSFQKEQLANRIIAALFGIFVLSNVLAQTPSPQSVSVGCPDNYGITVRGNNFAGDADIDIRAGGSYGAIIDNIRGSDVARSVENGQNVLRFTISNSGTRQTLNSEGLWLWVVNRSAGTWNGPVAVNRTTPGTPSTPSGNTAGSDGYSIQLSGTNFADNSYVDVRAANGTAILQSYSGGQLSRACDGERTVLTLSIADAAQRSYLNTVGLNFWIVNPSAGAWNGPKQIIRTGYSSVVPYSAQFVSQSVPSAMISGQSYAVSITFQNAGSNTWSSTDGYGYRLGSQNSQDNYVWGRNRVELPAAVPPNQQVTFSFNVIAPSTPGTYDFQWAMVHDGMAWIPGFSQNVTVQVALAPATQTQVQLKGGSNYNWYNVDFPGAGECNREPYGILKNYDQIEENGANTTVRAVVQNQLAQMYASGQRNLRIALYFSGEAETGTIIYLPGNTQLGTRYQANLANFLADIKNSGFENVEVGLFPLGFYYDQTEWTTTYPSAADQAVSQQTYWSLIQTVRSIVKNSGLSYILDLGNEALNTNAPLKKAYISSLWSSYINTYGGDDSVGFSFFIVRLSGYSDTTVLSKLGSFYAGRMPRAVEVHLYDYDGANEGSQLATLDYQLDQLGWANLPIQIGEVFYNDSATASSLTAVLPQLNRPIRSVLQWPLSRTGSQTASCNGQNVSSPLSGWASYKQFGF